MDRALTDFPANSFPSGLLNGRIDCGAVLTPWRAPRGDRCGSVEIAAINRKCSHVLGFSLRQVAEPSHIDQKAEGVIAGSSTPDLAYLHIPSSKVGANPNFDTALLAKVAAAARREGISRTAWLHRASLDALGE
jgi:hypothetical protein